MALTVYDIARRPNGRLLAELLAPGEPLALEVCLRYATEIATALRELHAEGRAHGSIDVAHIMIGGHGATLVPPQRRRFPDPLADLFGFGEVLFTMLNGQPPGSDIRVAPARFGALKGPAQVRSSAGKLAERCLTADRETAPDLQKILTELRLLLVMTKQFGADPFPRSAPPAPFLAPLPRVEPLAIRAPEAEAGESSPTPVQAPAGSEAEAEPDTQKQGEHATKTERARGSNSRPVLNDVACPKCRGYHVRLSRPRTAFERLLNLFGFGIHRCHRCFYRYVPFLGRKIARHGH